ncbi:MAG: hypothetical protein CL583_04005 [Alteromonadaceae bacterium]|nr:hypothetical protein [Alteromonadaceae bacterium]|tara:strand:- start:2140 stop:2889 length:750 start_codon:yes stop_codon:yes gene_type:complete
MHTARILIVMLLVMAPGMAMSANGGLLSGGQSVWEGEVELGILIDSGNTDATTLKGMLYLQQERSAWRNSIRASTRYRKVEDETTEQKYYLSNQTDFKFNETDYSFVRGRYDSDRFAALDYRASVVSGYGRRAWQRGERYLDLSLGLGYSITEYKVPTTSDEENDGLVSRLALDLVYPLSINAEFRQQASTEINMDSHESISQSITSVQASVGQTFALKVSYIVERDSDVPADRANTDTETSLTLLYEF